MGKTVWRENRDGEGEAVLRVIVVFWDRGGQALSKLDLSLKASDAKVLGDLEVVQKNLLEGGLRFRGWVVAAAAKLFEHLLGGGLGVVGLAEEV